MHLPQEASGVRQVLSAYISRTEQVMAWEETFARGGAVKVLCFEFCKTTGVSGASEMKAFAQGRYRVDFSNPLGLRERK